MPPMNLKPGTELKVVAAALLLLGVLLLGTLFVTAPAYGNFRDMPWHQMFRTGTAAFGLSQGLSRGFLRCAACSWNCQHGRWLADT